jgi:hypothetical protein
MCGKAIPSRPLRVQSCTHPNPGGGAGWFAGDGGPRLRALGCDGQYHSVSRNVEVALRAARLTRRRRSGVLLDRAASCSCAGPPMGPSVFASHCT